MIDSLLSLCSSTGFQIIALLLNMVKVAGGLIVAAANCTDFLLVSEFRAFMTPRQNVDWMSTQLLLFTTHTMKSTKELTLSALCKCAIAIVIAKLYHFYYLCNNSKHQTS